MNNRWISLVLVLSFVFTISSWLSWCSIVRKQLDTAATHDRRRQPRISAELFNVYDYAAYIDNSHISHTEAEGTALVQYYYNLFESCWLKRWRIQTGETAHVDRIAANYISFDKRKVNFHVNSDSQPQPVSTYQHCYCSTK